MNKIKPSLFFLVLLMLAGCAGTGMKVQTEYTPDPNATVAYFVEPEAEISAQGMQIFRQRLDDQFSASGLLEDSAMPSRNIEIVVTNYYMRHGAARAMAGIMAGSDNIQSTTTVKDANTGAVLGTFSVESKNPTALFTAKGLIEAHADKIVRYISSGDE